MPRKFKVGDGGRDDVSTTSAPTEVSTHLSSALSAGTWSESYATTGTLRAYWTSFQKLCVGSAVLREKTWISWTVFAVKLLFLMSFPLDLLLRPILGDGFNVAAFVREPEVNNMVVNYLIFWVMATVQMFTLAVFILAYALQHVGSPSRFMTGLVARLSPAAIVLWVPTFGLAICLLAESADKSTGEMVHGAFAVVVAVLALASAVRYTIFGSQHIPSASPVAVGSSRYYVISVVTLVVMHTVCAVAEHRISADEGSLWIYALVVLIGCTVLVAVVLYAVPFYYCLLNCIATGIHLAIAWCALCGFISACFPQDSVGLPSLIVFSAGLVPVGFGGGAICFYRIRRAERPLSASEDELRPLRMVQSVHGIESGFLLDLCLRMSIGKFASGNSLEYDVDKVLSRATHELPDSPAVWIIQALVALERDNDPRRASELARTALRLPGMADTRFVAMCVLEEARRRASAGARMANFENEHGRADRAERQARSYAALFWKLIADGGAMADGVELNRVLACISAVDASDRRSEKAVQSLLRRFPQEPRTWTLYARFLSFLRNDEIGAEEARTCADELEDKAAKTRSREQPPTVVHFGEGLAGSNGKKTHQERVQSPAAVHFGELSPGSNGSNGKAHQAPGRPRFPQEYATDEQTTIASSSGLAEPYPSVAMSEDKDNEDTASTLSGLSGISSAGALARVGAGIEQLKTVRRRIMSARTESASRLHSAALVTLCLLFASMLITYAVSQTTLNSYMDMLSIINSTGTCQEDSQQSLLRLREYEEELHHYDIYSPEIEFIRQEVREHATEFEITFTSMFQSSGISADLASLWSRPIANVSVYTPSANSSDPMDGNWYYRDFALWDFGYTFINSLRESIDPFILDEVDDLDLWPPYRFVFDNTPYEMEKHLDAVAKLLAEQSEASARIVQICLCVTLPATFVLCVGLYALVFWRTVRKATTERRDALRLFAEVPKGTMYTVRDRLFRGIEDREHASSSASKGDAGSTWFSNSRRLHIVYLGVLLLSLVMLSLLFGYVMQFVLSHGRIAWTQTYANERRNLCTRLLFFTHELILSQDDHQFSLWTYEENMEGLEELWAQFEEIDLQLKYCYADNEIPCENIQEFDHLNDLWFVRPCPVALNISDCYGVGVLMRHFLDALYIVYKSPPEMQNEDSYFLQKATEIFEYLNIWLQEDSKEIVDSVVDARTRINTVSSLVFWLSIPLALIAYPILRMSVEAVSRETDRLFKMLLHVPVNVLQTADGIRAFLEGTRTESVTEASLRAKREQQARTESVLAGCSDAIIVCGTDRNIEAFYPAAERLTGYSAHDMLKQEISLVLPDELGENKSVVKNIIEGNARGGGDVVVRRKDGKEVPALLSISHTAEHGRAIYAFFLRDVREIREREAQLVAQEQRARRFLLNVLPESVAEQMGDPGEGRLIARYYDSASLVFADAVEFSLLARRTQADTLVMALNDLYKRWDRLCPKFGVEKIKTIGDCYMAATGLPEPNPHHAEQAVRFARALYDELGQYNQVQSSENRLRFRVGISSGPVVAGVVGLSKWAYDVWGDTVNVAARMEQSGYPDRIQISQTTYELISDKPGFSFENRGKVMVKHLGEMQAYLIKEQVGDEFDGDDLLLEDSCK